MREVFAVRAVHFESLFFECVAWTSLSNGFFGLLTQDWRIRLIISSDVGDRSGLHCFSTVPVSLN